MTKAEKFTPAIGDQVKLRGRESRGELLFFGERLRWAQVRWSPDFPRGPAIVHLDELEPAP